MARLKLSALVSSMEGSLNGSSLHTGKDGVFLRNKSYPKQSNSRARVNSVNQFSSLVSQWSALTAAQKNEWNEFTRKYAEKTKDGHKYNPGGYAHFLAINRLRSSTNLSPLENPGIYDGKPYSISFEISEFLMRNNPTENVIQSLKLDVKLSGDNSNPSTFVVLMSQPLGKTSSRNFGTMYPVSYFSIPAGYDTNLQFSVFFPNINPNPLINLQPEKVYQINVIPLSEETAVYSKESSNTGTSSAANNQPAQFTNAKWLIGGNQFAYFDGSDLFRWRGGYERPGNTTSLAGWNIEGYYTSLSTEAPSSTFKSPFYFGPISYPSVSQTNNFPLWSTTNGENAAPIISDLPINMIKTPGLNSAPAAFRIKNNSTNEVSDVITGSTTLVDL